MAWFDIGGGQLFYEQHGSGDPPLVLLHGLACAHRDWRNQVSHFASSHRVVSLDLRGHGQSAGFVSGFDIGTFAEDLVALVARLELPPAVLVGHSLGCRVVLECARIAHASVAGLVLIEGSRFATTNGERARREMRRAIEESGYQAFFERIFRQMFTDSGDPQTRDAIIARALRLPRAVGMELMPQMVAWDGEFAEHALTSAKMPVTVLQSTQLDASRNRASLKAGETSPWLALVEKLAISGTRNESSSISTCVERVARRFRLHGTCRGSAQGCRGLPRSNRSCQRMVGDGESHWLDS